VAFVSGRPARLEARLLLTACAVLAVARLVAAHDAPTSEEFRNYWEPLAAEMARGGATLYQHPFPFYHFFPPWAWMVKGFHAISTTLGVPFASVQRVVLAAADIGTAFAVASLSRRLPGGLPPLRAAALYLANPIAFYVTSVQGQFDGLSLLCLLLAIRASIPPPGSPVGGLRAGLLLGASIAVKQVTALHPLLWLRAPRRAAAGAIAAVCLVPVATLLPYASEGWPMIKSLLVYGSVPVSYGFSELALLDARFVLPVSLLALAASLAAAWWLRGSTLERGALGLFLVILLFAPGMGSQYLLWPVALGSLYGGRRFLLYSAAATLWIVGGNLAWPGSGRWMGQLTWLAVILWTIGFFREEWVSRRGAVPA
jgi:hypothetical protein